MGFYARKKSKMKNIFYTKKKHVFETTWGDFGKNRSPIFSLHESEFFSARLKKFYDRFFNFLENFQKIFPKKVANRFTKIIELFSGITQKNYFRTKKVHFFPCVAHFQNLNSKSQLKNLSFYFFN